VNVPNLECHCITFTDDVEQIHSGWINACMRAIQSGKLLWTMYNAHHNVRLWALGQRQYAPFNSAQPLTASHAAVYDTKPLCKFSSVELDG
jgi:hypothetical protein